MSPTGHFAIAFASKKYAMKLNVFLLLFASFFIDIAYFISDALGGEIDGQLTFSHSFAAAIVFAVIFYGGTLIFTHNHKLGYVLGLVVFSHWILDFIVWDNLAWLPRSAQNIGLGLYTVVGVDAAHAKLNFATVFATSLELAMLIIGIVIYVRARKKQKLLNNIV